MLKLTSVMNILITGFAGFIGYHLAQRLLADGKQVYSVDNAILYTILLPMLIAI